MFLARERFGGVAAIRDAIQLEIRLLTSELATDLGRFPGMERWSTEDLQMLANLFVGAMTSVVEQVLMLDRRGGDDVDLITMARKQLTLIVLGVPAWNSKVGS